MQDNHPAPAAQWVVWCSSGLVTQSCPTLCDPMDCSLPGCSAHGILQLRILEWVAVPFSRGSSQPRDRTQVPALRADSLPTEPRFTGWNSSISLLRALAQFLMGKLKSHKLHSTVKRINKQKKIFLSHLV